MNANHVDFAPNIRQDAAALGRQPTAKQVEHLKLTKQSLAIVDPETMAVAMPAGDGQSVDVPTFLDQAAAEFAQIPEAVPAGSDRPDDLIRFTTGSSTSYRRADDSFVAITNAFKAAEAEKIAKEVAQWSNPWRNGRGFNRKRQSVISNTTPDFAAHFKA